MLILQKNLQIYFLITFCTCDNDYWSTQQKPETKANMKTYCHPEKNLNRKTENFKSKNRSYDEIIDNETT